MTAKNFNIKNGLSVAGTEVITSAGAIAGGAVNEAVDDRVNSLLQAGAGLDYHMMTVLEHLQLQVMLVISLVLTQVLV